MKRKTPHTLEKFKFWHEDLPKKKTGKVKRPTKINTQLFKDSISWFTGLIRFVIINLRVLTRKTAKTRKPHKSRAKPKGRIHNIPVSFREGLFGWKKEPLKIDWKWALITLLIGIIIGLLGHPAPPRSIPNTPPQHDSKLSLKPKLALKSLDRAKTVYIAPPVIKNVTRPVVASRANIEGNGYDLGYCTWYVKNRRPDIPNNWGDAYMWLGNAQSQGWATGSKPKAGAIGTAGNHVVYVESVSGNTIHISEMNAVGWNVLSERDAGASEFIYIY